MSEEISELELKLNYEFAYEDFLKALVTNAADISGYARTYIKAINELRNYQDYGFTEEGKK